MDSNVVYSIVLAITVSLLYYVISIILKKAHVPEQLQTNERREEREEREEPQHVGGSISTKKMSKKKLEKKQRKEYQRHVIAQKERALAEHMKAEKEKRKEERKLEEKRQQEAELEEQAWRKFLDEKEEQEQQEYMEWKSSIQLQSSGSVELEKQEAMQKSKEIIYYLQKNKVTTIEELIGQFQLKDEKSAVQVIQTLLKEERIFGFLDDNGKFICLTDEDIQNVVELVESEGKMSLNRFTKRCNEIVKKE